MDDHPTSPEPGEAPGSIAEARCLIIKIGSALLVEPDTGEVHTAWLDALIDDVARCHGRGQDVILVSSGAIAIGRRQLGLLDSRQLRLQEKQAAAATGQIALAQAYRESLSRHGIGAGLVLVTRDDTEQRRRHLNARDTLTALLGLRSVPIINENDTVATEEIRFGDNDRLAARVAQMMAADTLVLLSDIDGLYTADPRVDPSATLIPRVRSLTPEVLAMAGEPRPGDSSGGMVTKLAAARIATRSGCRMVIARGTDAGPLGLLEAGGPCTWFDSTESPANARKRWLANMLDVDAVVSIDAGAADALRSGGSLLPAGVTGIDGDFGRGDPVRVHSDGREIAHGLVAYTADEARRLMGRRSESFAELLGFRGPDELIHRQNLVLSSGTGARQEE